MPTFSRSSMATSLARRLESFRRVRRSSTSWSPTENTGSRAVCGSWNSIEIRSPRNSYIDSSSKPTRLTPSSRAEPVATAGGLSRMPRIARAWTVFPEPDSPRIARTSPWSSV
jgi:hypothetical protein